MPINSEHLASLTDAHVIDENGDKVGGVGQIYLDDATGQPAWASVKSGLFGLRESFVPLAAASIVDGNIRVPYTKDHIKDAPRVDAENHLDDSQQSTLFEYYGVDRGALGGSAQGGEYAGGADRTAAFSSEETAQDLYDGRTEGLPSSDSNSNSDADFDDERDGAVTAEYTTPGTDDMTAGAGVSGSDLGSGELTEGDVAPAAPDTGHGGDWGRDAAAIGAASAAGSGAARASAEPRTDDDTGLAQDGTFQQDTPATRSDWAAEQAPDEPVSTDWHTPLTDPADEEQTEVSRSGYSPDRPAAHSSAYEGHGDAAGAMTGSATFAAGETGAAYRTDDQVDEGAVYAADADAAAASDSGQYGTVEPVTTDSAPDAGSTAGEAGGFERVGDDTVVSGSDTPTGTGYPRDDSTGFGGTEVAGAAAGAAAGGYAADVSTTAYETPGAETGHPITGSTPDAAFASDVEQPADAMTQPDEAAMGSGTEFGAGDPTLPAGTDDGMGDDEGFGRQGYRPDRDGTEMSDEERQRLNEARGAL